MTSTAIIALVAVLSCGQAALAQAEEQLKGPSAPDSVAALTPQDLPNASEVLALPIVLPPGYKLNFTIGTSVSAGYMVTAFGGDY